MKKYGDIPLDSAHRLINHGPVVLVSTRDNEGKYDIAPMAWTSPVRKEPPKILVVVGKRHKTHENVIAQGEFIVCVPHQSQIDLVAKTGSVSGSDVDKFKEFDIRAFKGRKIDAMIPEGCIGFIECKLYDTVSVEAVDILIGEVVAVSADTSVFKERLLTEKPEGKTLHHLGGDSFAVPSDRIHKPEA